MSIDMRDEWLREDSDEIGRLNDDLKEALDRCYLLERELEKEQRRADRAEELLASCREISAQRAKELMGLKERYGLR